MKSVLLLHYGSSHAQKDAPIIHHDEKAQDSNRICERIHETYADKPRLVEGLRDNEIAVEKDGVANYTHCKEASKKLSERSQKRR